jgi:NADPH:quinone reductase-like Zn-dependent oxidoreductase
MKAIVYEKYGPPEVLQLREVAKPVPKDNEVLIRIHATTVTSGDCRLRALNVPTGFGFLSRLALGVSKPRQAILGVVLAGVVEETGGSVRGYKAGDRVFGLGGARMGCYAEYRCIPEDAPLAMMPSGVRFDVAAAIPFGGTTALDFFRRGKLKSGETVLINGASGAVGTAAVQLARHCGAEVTGVCSAANTELVLSLGAARVIDYNREDFTRNGETYDVIVDTVGTAPYARSKASLKKNGRLLLVLAGLPDMLPIPWVSLTSGRKIIAGSATERSEDLRFLAELVQAGAFTPVIDRRYRFEQMAQAHGYVDSRRKKGNVVVLVSESC